MVGKWHLGYRPELTPPRRGFDEFYGFLSGAHNYLPGGRRSDLRRGMEAVTDEKEYLTDAFGREAAAFIQKNKAQPFFLYLPFNAVHAPLEASEQYLRRVGSIKEATRRTYAAMTVAMDDAVGRVLARLREHGIEEHTLIVFLSDNGGPTPQTSSSNAPLRGYKAQMWEGGIRVPFIMQWKGRLPAGKVYERPVIVMDILPTAIAAAGGAIAPEWKLDGVNLMSYLGGQEAGRPHETLCWRMGAKHAIRHGDWKLVAERDLPKPALFNLAEDIGEKNDLAGKMPDKLKELTALYDAWAAQMMEPQWVRQDGRGGPGQQGARLADRFRQLDRNGDGKLTADELPRPDLFKAMDANADGVVTREEARAYFTGRR
jgi:arylsulfatase A-like enzyme